MSIILLYLAKIKSMAKKQKKTRNDARIADIPDQLFKDLTNNAEKEGRSIGKEIVIFLQKKKYK